MFSGPMFRWESKSATRRFRPFMYRVVFGVILGILALMIMQIVFRADSRMTPQARMELFGRALLVTLVPVELVILLVFVPSHVAGSIPEERSRDTLSLLMLTKLRPIEIVATKTFARWWPTTGPILTGLPLFILASWSAGLEWETGLAIVGLFSCSIFMSLLTILASSQRVRSDTAFAQAVGWIFLWMVAPPLLSLAPIRTGSFWGDLFDTLRWPLALVAPSSPLSLVTDNGWYYHRPGSVGLEGRIAGMIGLQGLFGALAMVAAAAQLSPREPNPNRLDPTRGHRPRCGDDPIFWREFDLPIRRGAGPLIVIRLRAVRIIIRGILTSLLGLFALSLILAVPIGLLVGTISYGTAAFRELLAHGSGSAGPFIARGNFNLLIRAATGLLGLLPALGAASIVSARITTERDKKTWDIFLTTPLEGPEILRSKAIVAAQGFWQHGWPILVLWTLGMACGAITPVGVALAAVDLASLFWASVALGLTLGIRPGTTNSANNQAALWMLIFLFLHTPTLAAALASPPELAVFATWDLRLRVGLIVLSMMVPAFTGAMAWRWTRRSRDRFDEWVGRPIRSDPGE